MAGVSGGSWVYWLIGVITAFLTSFYMFRLVVHDLFGSITGDQAPVARSTDTTAHGHGHGAPTRESDGDDGSASRFWPSLSVTGGWVGFGGSASNISRVPVFMRTASAKMADLKRSG